MSTAVAKTEHNYPVAQVAQNPTGILASDVIIPRLLLMQGTSDAVKDRKAQLGDIIRSTDGLKLGSPDKGFDIIPLSVPKATWIKECRPKGSQRWEFRGQEDRTAANDTLPWSFNADKDGKLLPENAVSSHEWRRVKCLSLFALLPDAIDAANEEMKKAEAGELPDLSKALTPVLVVFRSTSFNSGKEVTTHFTEAQMLKQPGWRYTLHLSCYLDQNDQGSYYVWKVERTKRKPVKTDHIPQVQAWADIVGSAAASLRVDESGDDGAANEGARQGPSQF